MTREEAKIWLNKLYTRTDITNEYGDMEDMQPYEEALDMAIKALEQEPCDDCISRADIKKHKVYSTERHEYVVPVANIDWQPSVSPQPKVGKWEWVQYDGNPNIGDWHCSECNRIVSGAIAYFNPANSYRYCPNCGAKMEVQE